ncbi:MAG: hypothetical protein HYT37_03335 [Candidatus Sungbacteria bacterium]|nr:hypothetical protein [Candidatus Sungbacteria bacterium]
MEVATLTEVLVCINQTRSVLNKKALANMPQGRRYSASCCPLKLALADCGVVSVGIISVQVKTRTSAQKLARLWSTEIRNADASTRYIVDLIPLLYEFRKNFDSGSYPELILP